MIRNSTLLLVILLTLSTKAFSQAPIVYHMGFDTAFAPAGWQAYRKGVVTTYNWSNSSFGAYAGDGFLYHDYPVGAAGTDTTVDWYVSPAFSFAAGGKIDSVHLNIYTFATRAPVDFFGIYLLNGSQDPAAATSTTLLADVSYMASSTDTWSDTVNIVIPPTSGASYIGFKYRATTNWFTIGVDELYLTRNATTSIGEQINENEISLYPNPTTGLIYLNTNDKSIYDNESTICIYDQLGKQVEVQALVEKQPIRLQVADGLYFYKIMSAGINKGMGRMEVKN